MAKIAHTVGSLSGGAGFVHDGQTAREGTTRSKPPRDPEARRAALTPGRRNTAGLKWSPPRRRSGRMPASPGKSPPTNLPSTGSVYATNTILAQSPKLPSSPRPLRASSQEMLPDPQFPPRGETAAPRPRARDRFCLHELPEVLPLKAHVIKDLKTYLAPARGCTKNARSLSRAGVLSWRQARRAG